MLTQRFPRCQSTSSRVSNPGFRRYLRTEPVEDLLAGPMHDAGLAKDVSIELLEVTDAMRDPGYIGMHTDRHDPARDGTFFVQAIELGAAAAQHLLGRVVLNDHHRDIVDLHGVRHREHRAARSRYVDRLVVEHPVGDILDPKLGTV